MADIEVQVVLLGSDMIIEVANLKNSLTKTLLTGATVTAEVFASDGTTPIAGFTNPITLAEVSSKKGLYQGTLPDVAVVSLGDKLKIEVISDAGAGLRLRVMLDAVVREQQH